MFALCGVWCVVPGPSWDSPECLRCVAFGVWFQGRRGTALNVCAVWRWRLVCGSRAVVGQPWMFALCGVWFVVPGPSWDSPECLRCVAFGLWFQGRRGTTLNVCAVWRLVCGSRAVVGQPWMFALSEGGVWFVVPGPSWDSPECLRCVAFGVWFQGRRGTALNVCAVWRWRLVCGSRAVVGQPWMFALSEGGVWFVVPGPSWDSPECLRCLKVAFGLWFQGRRGTALNVCAVWRLVCGWFQGRRGTALNVCAVWRLVCGSRAVVGQPWMFALSEGSVWFVVVQGRRGTALNVCAVWRLVCGSRARAVVGQPWMFALCGVWFVVPGPSWDSPECLRCLKVAFGLWLSRAVVGQPWMFALCGVWFVVPGPSWDSPECLRCVAFGLWFQGRRGTALNVCAVWR